MNYPIWDLQNIGGGTLIAAIAVIHAFVAHFAVGGGLYLVLTEIKAVRENDQHLMNYVKKHTKFFLLLTMVFGGISGVGIWFSIALVNPAATSTLIHHFVFGWATEWVFFIGEIVALLIYHYRFEKMNQKDHIRMGWLYFIFAWLSLFIINGILTFMLTPGKWIETQSFWHGFFNPGMWPALFYRTGMALLIAGIFGLITAVNNKTEIKTKLFTYAIKWVYIPAILIIVSGFWYYKMTPQTSLDNLFIYNPESVRFINYFIVGSILVFAVGILFLIKLPSFIHKFAVLLLILSGFSWFGGFEYIREIARKPFILNDYMYSNSLKKEDIKLFNLKGFLNEAKWTQIKKVTSENQLDAGKEIFLHQCHACHTLEGYNALAPRTEKLTQRGLLAIIEGLGTFNTYMPPFAGNMAEKEALAAYIYQVVHNNPVKKEENYIAPDLPVKPSPFDNKNSEYVLLAWNDLGMHCISDNDQYFSFLPPANALWCQLIKRGAKPEIVTEGFRIEFEVEEGFRHPENHVDFWEHASTVYGAQLEEGKGLAGFGVSGHMHANPEKGVFTAELIPVTPYNDNGQYNPYPLFTLKAYNENNNELLVETQVVAPTSTEVGCRNCHQGDWRWNGVSGLADLTAENILSAHDRMHKTTLLKDAKNGQPKLCQSCHADPALGAPGKPGIPNFSTAIHGFHANYLPNNNHEACVMCHPSREKGNTLCSRGHHNTKGLTCIDCHGVLEDHALALLKFEKNMDKKGASRMMANLNPKAVSSVPEIDPRMPWLREPNCLSCHTKFNVRNNKAPKKSFNNWYDGSPHAIYASVNAYGANRDNLQPLQYQGIAGPIGTQNNCMVCHKKMMHTNGHHMNMLKPLSIKN